MGASYEERSRVSTRVGEWLPSSLQATYSNPWPTLVDLTSAVSFTCDAVAHTKGAWTELIASTTAESNFLVAIVYAIAQSGQATGTLIDIGVGASGSEVVIAGNIAVGSSNFNDPITQFPLPLNIPAGSRVAVRGQSVFSSRTGVIRIATFDGEKVLSSLDVLGTNTATSVGTTPGNNGAWAEVVASSTKLYRYLIFVPSGSSSNIGATNQFMSLGVGASGSETTIGKVAIKTTSGEAFGLQFPYLYDSLIVDGLRYPPGSRFAASCSGSNGGWGVTLIGVPA